MIVDIKSRAGDFAEDKDLAADIRDTVLRPAVRDRSKVTLDFAGVSLVTQSFIHALIADVLRTSGEDALGLLVFKGCAPSIKGIIGTVVQYSLESVVENEIEAKPPNQELEPAGARRARRTARRKASARPRRKS